VLAYADWDDAKADAGTVGVIKQTAQLHLVFGVVFSLAIVLAIFVKIPF